MSMLYLFVLNAVVVVVTLLAIVAKLYSSPKRYVREPANVYYNPWSDPFSAVFSDYQVAKRKVGFEQSDFVFNIFMLVLGMAMIYLGVFYNAGFDLLGLYDVAVSGQLLYPWAFLFLVGGSVIILINSFFAFLKMMD